MKPGLFAAAYHCLTHTRRRLIHRDLSTHEIDVVLDMFHEELREQGRADEQTEDLAGFPSGVA